MEMTKTTDKVFTIPNILSLFRIFLIPVIVLLYSCGYNGYAVGVLVLSGATDIVDGYIARHFNMISNVGKILDPIADKLTQAVILFCLMSRFRFMIILFSWLVVKELSLSIMGLFVVRKTKIVKSANWHGKITTFLLYFTMSIHIIWGDIPKAVSHIAVAACLTFMVLSFVLYVGRNLKQLHEQQ